MCIYIYLYTYVHKYCAMKVFTNNTQHKKGWPRLQASREAQVDPAPHGSTDLFSVPPQAWFECQEHRMTAARPSVSHKHISVSLFLRIDIENRHRPTQI